MTLSIVIARGVVAVTGRLGSAQLRSCEATAKVAEGHPAATSAKRDDVHIEGTTLKWYEPVEGTEYGFCGNCGSTLFWRSSRYPKFMSIAAGTLTPPTGLKTTTAIFLDYGREYHHYDDSLDNYGDDRPDRHTPGGT